ncbi:hypothetical protein Cgig2_012499 [Carnegiea gigantea]|uniref:Uncharacterized protein n=1 Tax=Carnegiea gigantea TaxID=171969 RepID=A0A9Q1K6C1_9CARY|nr:hypothetical protein Cgig2_012499 [Carnegiea gigantea]
MLSIKGLTEPHVIEHELETGQPSSSQPLSSCQPSKSSQPILESLEDIDVDQGGLSSYDLRSLSHLTSASHYDAGYESGLEDKDEDESGSNEEETDADSEDNTDSEVGSEGGSGESLVDSDEVHDDDIDSDIEQFLHPTVMDDISKHIEVADVDDDGLPTPSMWNKVYQDGSMWARNPDGKVSIKAGDMFVDKEQWAKVIREYAI